MYMMRRVHAERCPNGCRWIEVKCPEKDCGNTFSVEDKPAKAVLV